MDQSPDPRNRDQFNIKSTRERLEEVRRQREERGVGYQISRAPSTILTNMIIQILSTVILGVGIYYIIWYLNFRRDQMLPQHYQIFVGTMLLVGAGWIVYTFFRLRTDYLRYREAVHRRDARRKERSERMNRL